MWRLAYVQTRQARPVAGDSSGVEQRLRHLYEAAQRAREAVRATHPLTGITLRQPCPAPLRIRAIWDADKPCLQHAVAYSGSVPCTGAIQCYICETTWDDNGTPETPAQRNARLGGEDGKHA